MVKKKCVETEKKNAEKTRKKLDEKNTLDKNYKVKKENNKIYFPVEKRLKEFKVVKKDVEKKKKEPNSLEEALKVNLTEKQRNNLVTSFDIIGDIAVIEIPKELQEIEKQIGKAIMKIHKSVSTVCKRKTRTKGKYRIRPVQPITGEQKTETTHKEHGVKIKIDLNKAYFNPRLSRERERIAELTEEGEEIGYFFAGVGPFALVIARKKPKTNITAVELNPEAYKYLKENIELNNFEEIITPLHKDVKDIKKQDFDRIIMPLPLTSEKYLHTALKNSSKGTKIHYYSLGKKPNYFEKPLEDIENQIENFKVLNKREVLNYSPGKKEVVIDLEITSIPRHSKNQF